VVAGKVAAAIRKSFQRFDVFVVEKLLCGPLLIL
jgi:hypothetical protein